MIKKGLLEKIVAGAVFSAAAFLSPLQTACGPSQKSNTFRTTPDVVIGSLKVFNALEMDAKERSEAGQAVQEHFIYFFVFYGYPQGTNTDRDFYVHDAPHINAPYANTVQGWIDYDNNYAIHVTKGEANEVPEGLAMMVQSYFHNQPQPAQFWANVKTIQKNFVTNPLRIQRGFAPIP